MKTDSLMKLVIFVRVLILYYYFDLNNIQYWECDLFSKHLNRKSLIYSTQFLLFMNHYTLSQ